MRYKLMFGIGALSLMFSMVSYAGHNWNGYHWASNSVTTPIALKVIDSTTSAWDGQRVEMQEQWSYSPRLALATDSANDKKNVRSRCPLKAGQLRVCNYFYGNTGWVGIATINLDSSGHITHARAAMNDSYVDYWTLERKNHVMCQEIGHIFGLNHTSEDGSSQQTCMDYSNDTLSQYPNQHDYDQLLAIYGHSDGYNSYDDSTSDDGSTCNSPPGRGCNSTAKGKEMNGMGIKVIANKYYELWVAPGKKGGLILNHLYLK